MTINIASIVNNYSNQVVDLREKNERLQQRIKELEHQLERARWEAADYRPIVHDLVLDGDYDAKKVWDAWNDDEEDED